MLSVPPINEFLHTQYEEQKLFFKKGGIRCLEIGKPENFIKDVVKFFKGLP